LFDLDAGLAELVGFLGGGVGGVEEEVGLPTFLGVLTGGCDEAGGGGEAEVGVENDAEERAAAGQSAAVGEERVVVEDGADAGEDGVGGVAHALDGDQGVGRGEIGGAGRRELPRFGNGFGN
jgi:hypothetical protein